VSGRAEARELRWNFGTPSYRLRAVRQLVFHGPRRLSVEDAEPPRVGRDEVRVAVHSVGVCGSDVHGYAGVNARRSPGMVMGHEAVGFVTELGDAVEGLEQGQPVAINPVVSCGECELCRDGHDNLCERRRIYGCVPGLAGAYAEQVVVPAANVVAFDGAAPLEWGALVEPLSVGAHAARIASPRPGEQALVVGGGPIGLATALFAQWRGASGVVVSEPQEHRRRIAERLGFGTLDPAAEETPRSEFPLAFECVGHSVTLSAALHAVRPRGRVVFVGLAEETIGLPATPLMVGERTIAGSSAYSAKDFRDTAVWAARRSADLSPLIELRVGLDELPGVFEGYADGSLQALKTLLQFDGEGKAGDG
jgi:2-desacetyl-2-hydroxyethyl bacteriochlorophyllide A dehydrogenase